MRRAALNLFLILCVAGVGGLTWLGQQQTPDLFLQHIQARGTLRVGIDPTYPPFDTLQGGQVAGYDADLARAIAHDLGVEVEFHTLALDTLYDALAADNIDAIISAQPPIPERQKEVRYSQPYYQAGQVLVVRSGETAITALATLEGKRVGLELGSSADTEARKLQRTTIKGMRPEPIYRTPLEALDALANGKVDAVITDYTSTQAAMSSLPGSLKVLSPPVTDEPYVVAVPAQANGLATSINATIDRMRASGELARIMEGRHK